MKTSVSGLKLTSPANTIGFKRLVHIHNTYETLHSIEEWLYIFMMLTLLKIIQELIE